MEHEIEVDFEAFQHIEQTGQTESFLKHNDFVFSQQYNIPLGCIVYRKTPEGKIKIIQGI